MARASVVESIQLAAVEFSSGVELLEAYDWTQPGCVVLELLLPDMSGLDLLRKLVTPPPMNVGERVSR